MSKISRVHGVDGLHDALAAIARTAIAQLDRFMRARGCARRHGGAAERAILQRDIDLDGGIAPAVQDFAGGDVDDGGHGALSPRRARF